ncbi:hypothetical protein [Brevibacillus sp. AY1]|uniref:hypothetical protein n=1 Tax=Brevibacillus sp. AY1 TaxID=2807621 RepID=UPI002454F0CB|nr:hypothetical protein [Brevibacillus sp. AY1]MDH4617632.1 hypothetical protein [Brevibacillus sp. AY1]
MSNLTSLILDLDIESNEDRNQNYPLCINISFQELKNEDIRKVVSKLKYFHYTEKESLQNRIVLRFYGYQPEDGKELFEIKLIRKWVQKLYQHMPYLFYFLSEDFECARNIFLCLASVNNKAYIGEKIAIDFFEKETKPLVRQISHNAIAFGQQENRVGLEELKEVLKRTVTPFKL